MNPESVLTALLAAAILSSMPLMLAAVGESIGQQAGVLNLGVEGTMLLGAFVAFRVAIGQGNLPAGLFAGVVIGAAIGLVFGVLATSARADQVVLGLGLTLAGAGLSGFLFREVYGSTQPLLDIGMSRPLSGLGGAVPILGSAVLGQRWFVYVAWLLVAAGHLALHRSGWGLKVRAAGAAPFALEAAGASVTRTRIGASTVAGAFAGLGGASLALVELGFFTPGLTSGAGFLAIALAMLGRLSPLRVASASLLFGMLTGLDTGLQIAGVNVQPEITRMAPYLGIVIALVLIGRRVRLPAALGLPYGSPPTRRSPGP
ncbi:MAG: ABC transporter permease [Chloroflexia bacterium]|nr:ABC transporter permease [Chloroflexia bacterium]